MQLEEITRSGHSNGTQYFSCLVRDSLSEEVTFKVRLRGEGRKKSFEAEVRAPALEVERAWWGSVREMLGGGGRHWSHMLRQ